MSTDADALIIGAGPAGASAAIRLAAAGWHVILVEQQLYPRQKVCGECIAPAGWGLLDELGVGPELRRLAGPDLRQVGWMSEHESLVAQMPACSDGRYPYGRALGRDYLDAILLERARSLGVTVLQPAKLLGASGAAGRFDCQIETRWPDISGSTESRAQVTLRAAIVIDAHGSWERELVFSSGARIASARPVRSDSELLAFKATFRNAGLSNGFLPVIAFNGGYGGMVKADHGRTTIACCIRRDTLEQYRREAPGKAAGEAIEAHLRRCCHGIDVALGDGQRDGPWLAVGPIRPGVRVSKPGPFLRVGNAAGESHPLIGEGIGMALQSAALLSAELGRPPTTARSWKNFDRIHQRYAVEWRRKFASRLGVARLFAHIAMRPVLRPAANVILSRLPQALTLAALVAGKARPTSHRVSLN